ncbi:hypothetical protein ASPTUDRAFT_55315 [Aspergillus tubingensis CBS 134.48]|uniref:Uncharacterized protein n=1 Tax=Aspergillus tubingensis (strain CBS 134.48) TaxID=767770 RepID=A0A1L9N8S8_ASPTC|nr:hypothetical protein ASPTUDRAFT_55315 [Aspergillus tubingensis CBS 134.48]
MRSRPRASVERPLDTARLVLGFLDPGEGFSVGPGLPSFTRGSRIAAVAPSSIQHPSRASDLRGRGTCCTPLPRAPRNTMMTTNQLLSGRGQSLTIDYSQLHVLRGCAIVIRQRASRRPQQQQMLDISSSSAILARSNYPQFSNLISIPHPHARAPQRATVAANPPSIDDAPCFAELLLPSDQQNPINRAIAAWLFFRAAVRMLGSGLARALPDSGNYCPSVPGRLAVGQSWNRHGTVQNDRVWNGYRQDKMEGYRTRTATTSQLICVK